MKTELLTLHQVDHQHCARVMQLLEGDKHIYIVMEHIVNGNLEDLIVNPAYNLSQDACFHVMR